MGWFDPVGWVEAGVVGGVAEAASFEVSGGEGCAGRGREHVVAGGCVGRGEFVPFEQGGELGEEGDVADRGGGLEPHPLGRLRSGAARELVADSDELVGEVDFGPGEAE